MAINISPVNIQSRQEIGIKPGDTVRVWQKIQEKGKTRLQAFEGLVLARRHGNEPGATFTVRRVSGSVGIEKIFPLYSPMIDKIEIVKRSKVRRAKLYYIREKVAKEIRRQMRNMRMMDVSTVSDSGEKDAEAKAAEEESAVKDEEESAEEVAEKTPEESKKDTPAEEAPEASGDASPKKE